MTFDLDEYMKQGGTKSGKSDVFDLDEYMRQTSSPVVEAQPVETEPTFADNHPFISSIPEAGRQFGKRAVKSYPEFARGVNDLVALVGDKTGLDGLSNYGKSGAEYWQNVADNIKADTQYQGLEGLKSKKTFLPTLAGEVGGQTTNLLMALGGGSAGGLASKAAGLGKVGTGAATFAGTSIPNLAQEGQYLDKIEAFKNAYGRMPNADELNQIQNVALNEKAINTALETVADRLLLGKLFPEGTASKGIKNIAKNMGQQGLTEGLTETAQEGVSVGAEKLLGLNSDDWQTNLARMGEAGTLGALTGSVIGGATTAASQPYDTQFKENQNIQNAIDAVKNVSAQVFSNGKELYNSASEPTAFDLMRDLSKQGTYTPAIEEIAPNIAASIKNEETEAKPAKATKRKERIKKKIEEIAPKTAEKIKASDVKQEDVIYSDKKEALPQEELEENSSNEDIEEAIVEPVNQAIEENNEEVQKTSSKPKQYKMVNGKTVRVDAEPTEAIKKIAPKTVAKIEQTKENERVENTENLQANETVGQQGNANNEIENLAKEYSQMLGQNEVRDFHRDFATALVNKNADKIKNLVAQGRGMNENSKKMFTKYTGIKLPSTIQGKKDVIDKWANGEITSETKSEEITNSLHPSLKYKVSVSKDGLNADGLYMEGSNFHTDGNAAYLNEFVNADTSKVERVTKANESAEQQMKKFLDNASQYTNKLEDIGKGIKRNKETWRVFKAGEYDNGEPKYVVINDKYLLDKKDLELYSDDENLYHPMSIRKNGKQIGIVMPITQRNGFNTSDMVDIKPMKTTAKKAVESKPEEKQEEIPEENIEETTEESSEVEKDINVPSKNATVEEKTPQSSDTVEEESAQVESKSEQVKPKENTSKKPSKKKESKKLDDAGEFLQGNRKQDTSLTWNELKDMNDLIRAKNTTKAKVYPKPTLEELEKEGFSEFQAGVILNVYNKINAKPAAGYDKIEHQKLYVDTINEVMGSIKDYIKSHSDEFSTDLITEAAKKYQSWSYDYNKSLFDVVFPDTENKKSTNRYSSIFRLYPEYNRKAIIIGGNKFTGALQLNSRTLVDVMKAIEDSKKVKEAGGKVKKESWEKNFVILEPDRWNKEYAVANKKSKQVYAKYATKEEAIAAAKRVQEKIDAFKDTKANFVRDYIERRENNKDVTTEELREAFGFRGVNFGNWTNEKERQNFVNFAYDSLYDLAELLNLPPKAMSLNGQLGLAYGAQGTGGKKAAAAHYIPEYKDINLTKEYGAGSLAHEWWHALDNYFGNQATNKEYSREWALSITNGGELRPELFKALENLQTQIKKAPFTEEDIKKNAERLTARYNRNIEYYAENIKNNYKRAKNADELLKIVDDLVENKEKYKSYPMEKLHAIENKFFKLLPENRDTLTNRGEFNWLLGAISRLNDIDELARKGANKTEYLQNAEKIDRQEGGKYWSEDTELGARAFAAYMFDKMANQNIVNRFLTRSGDGAVLNLDAFKELAEGEEKEPLTISTTPKGEERKRIFDAFDKLFKTIKTRETEKGVELYSFGENPEYLGRNNDNTKLSDYWDFSRKPLEDVLDSTGVRQLSDDMLDTVGEYITTHNLGLDSAKIRELLGQLRKSYSISTEGYKEGSTEKGAHAPYNVYINPYEVKTLSDFVRTAFHEQWHMVQTLIESEILKIPEKQRTEEQINFLKERENGRNVNEEMRNYFDKNPFVKRIFVKHKHLLQVSGQRAKRYLRLIKKLRPFLYKEYNRFNNTVLKKYYNTAAEKEANNVEDKIGEHYGSRIELYQQGLQKSSNDERNILSGRNDSEGLRGSGKNGGSRLGKIGTGTHKEVRLSSIGQVNKNTGDEISKVVRDKVYDWHGNLESDRYDVDKALNSFINLTKHKAKNISGKTGLKVTDKQLREIMPFLRERTGFPESLERDDLRTLFNKLDKTNKAELTKLADSVSDKFEKYYKNYKEAKGEQTEESIENHISHIWDLDDKKKSLLTNFITTNSKFAKQRTIGTLVEGIDGVEIDGEKVQFKPKTLDYAEILKSSSDNLIKATHDSILANEIKNLKYRGESLVLPAAKAPSEWVEVNHPALNKAVYMGSVGKDEIPLMMKNPVKVHPEIADYVSAVFEVQKNSKFWTAFDSLNGMIKQGLLGFSGFHGYALSESSIGNAGVGKTLKELNPKKFVDAIKNGNYDVYKNEEAAKRAINAGVQLGTPSDLQRNLVEEVLLNGWHIEKFGINKITEPVGKLVKPLGKIAHSLVSANNKILWDVLHNNFKILAFNTAIENLGENVTKEQERAVAQWVNDSFGGQAWELLGIKKSTIKAASRVLLSPDWNFSTIRQAAAAINSEWLDSKINQTPLGKRIGKLTGVSEETSSNGARGKIGKGFWIRSAIFFTVFYNLLNAAFRERDRKEHPELYPKEMTPMDYSIWANSYPMDNIYDRIMPKVFIGRNSDGTARMLRVGKQFREVPEFITEPVSKLGGKTSPLINIASQVGLGMSAGDAIKVWNGGEVYRNQDIWDGYGADAKKREGMDLARGRVKALGKSLTPFIASKYIGGKHEFSAWDFFAQTNAGASKSKVYKQTMAALESGQEEKIKLIKRHAYQDGLRPEDINKMVGYAKKNYQVENTKRYKKDLVAAIENKDKAAAQKIKKSMEKRKLSKEEQKRILGNALKEYQKSNKN